MNVNSVSLKGSERIRESDGASPDTGRTQGASGQVAKAKSKRLQTLWDCAGYRARQAKRDGNEYG